MATELHYRERQQQLIFDRTGERDVLKLPLEQFSNSKPISVLKVRGSVRGMNEMLATPEEDEALIQEFLKVELP